MDSGCRELKFSGGSGINMDGETTERNGERAMNKDMCVVCDDGILNIRAGAIIRKDGKLLMVSNDRATPYRNIKLYSVDQYGKISLWISK